MVEESIIGAILNDAVYCKQHVINLESEYFYDTENREIFETIKQLYQDEVVPDLVTVGNYLKNNDKLSSWDKLIGAVEDSLPRQYNIPSSANIQSYIRVLIEEYIKKQNIRLGQELELGNGEPDILKEDYSRKIKEAELLIKKEETKNIVELCSVDFLHKIDTREKPKYLKTDLKDIDKIVGGILPTDFWIIASRTGIGKTTLALNIIKNVSSLKIPTCFISLEMSKEQLFQKLVCSEAKIDYDKILNNELNKSEIDIIAKGVAKLYKHPIYVNDTTGGKITNVLNYAKSLLIEKEVQLIVIDYLQLLMISGNKENRNSELSEISRNIKTFTLENKTPIIGLAQLNRQIETRANKIPSLADLKDCGSFEQDADRVLFISRKQDYEKLDNEEYEPAKIYIAKNRHGKTGMVWLRFFGEYQLFKDFTDKYEPSEVPF